MTSTVTDETRDSAHAWYVVVLLMLIYTSSIVDRTVIALLVGPIRADLQISDTEMSLLSGLAFAIFYTTLGVPIGRLADRKSRRAIIAAGAFTWSIMTALCGLAQGFTQLFLARVGVGVGEATLTPAAYSLISDSFPRHRLARALGIYNIGISLGGGLALLFGGLVIGWVAASPPPVVPGIGALRPWQTVFLIVALPGVVLSALMGTVREPKRRGLAVSGGKVEQLSFGEVIGYLWGRRAVYGPLYAGFSLLGLVNFGFNAWIPTHFIRSYGWTAAETGQRYGLVMLVCGTIGSLVGGQFADRMLKGGRREAYVRTTILCCLGLAPLSVAAPLMPEAWLSLMLFGGWLFLNGAWYSVCGGTIQLVAPNQLRGQATAIMFLFSSMVGFGLGPTAIAALTDFAFGDDRALRYALAIVGAVAMPLAILIFRRGERRFAEEVAAMEGS